MSLAGVLSMEAGVLLFDEPLANLDPASGKHAMALIEDIHQQTGKTILIIEHRVEDVLEQPVDRIVIMAEGRIVRTGTPDEILASSVMSTHGLREPLYVTALKYAGCELTPEDRPSSLERVSADPDNRSRLAAFAAAADPVKPLPDREPLVEMDNVRYSYDGEREVIRGVSLTIGQGERLALLGNNGAGKSTLSHLLTGIAKPSSGSIRLLGEDTRSWSIRRLGQQIGYVMQNPNHMITQAMIWDEVALGLRVRGLGERTSLPVSRRRSASAVCTATGNGRFPL